MVRKEELTAMAALHDALEGLEPAERIRVLTWALAAYRNAQSGVGVNQPSPDTGEAGETEDRRFDTFAKMFDAANPTETSDRALVAAYWCEQKTGKEEWTAQSVNTELKNLGYPVGHITDALASLIGKSPALVRQTSKSGTSRQARKTYTLTEAGRRRVKEMLSPKQGKQQMEV